MELKKQNSNSSNKIDIVDNIPTKNIFESLTDGWDKEYKPDETHPYLKEVDEYNDFQKEDNFFVTNLPKKSLEEAEPS